MQITFGHHDQKQEKTLPSKRVRWPCVRPVSLCGHVFVRHWYSQSRYDSNKTNMALEQRHQMILLW